MSFQRRSRRYKVKKIVGYYGGENRNSLLQDGDILLVFESIELLHNFVKLHHLKGVTKSYPMYFDDLVAGLSIGGMYGLDKGSAALFIAFWEKQFQEPCAIKSSDLARETDFITLSIGRHP